MAIQIEIGEIFTAGVELLSYNTAIKAAEMLDTKRIDSFEKNSDLFRKLKSRCEAQGYTVEQAKWNYGIQPYIDVMLNLQKNKHKALCKHFSSECRRAMVTFDEFINCDDENAVDDAYIKWSNGYELEIQLPIYMKQEKTKQAIYLIIDNGHPKALESFISFYNGLDQEIKGKISYFIIDATPKLSASNA